MHNYKAFYIDGNWVIPSDERDVIKVINPATEETVGEVLQGTHEDVDSAVAAAKRAFDGYSQSTKSERLELLTRIIEIYERRMPDMAQAITDEMGATKKLAIDDQAPCGLGHLRTAYEALKNYNFENKLSDNTTVFKEPIGVCAFITPWNWPINQIAAKVAPALATGCTCVLKPSELAPFSAHVFAEILHEAGVPKGVFNLVDGNGIIVGAHLSSHPDVDMVSFTGSTRAGIEVAKAAAPTVKRVTQELGGKSANIILDDADFETAVFKGTLHCMGNVGQSCNSPTRMLVPHYRMEEAAEVAAKAVSKLRVGDPTNADKNMGPIAYDLQYEKVKGLIQKAIDEGTTLVCGGTDKPEGCEKGYFVKPTVFSHVTNDMTIAKEEVFGPVLSIIGYDNEAEAIQIANDTPYGLAAYVSSSDLPRARRVASKLRAGQVIINNSAGDYNVPFGGYKQSGNGREKGEYGFEDFLEIKAIIGYNVAG
ncbi:aldehyde dehydrogenase family protein [Kiloniella antarctica]|uniref:Aldehyde dehydrogenase family protein n=1 Tax=Kiloniella antarctica TaxID=1550907 RepID=A0ABW5BGL3_9PROT